jgi:hypothetical protein
VSHRLQITVPDDIAARLERVAQRSRESTSHAGARLLIAALDTDSDDRRAAPTPSHASNGESLRSRPPRLEPYGDADNRRRWRREMWASIRALYQRYDLALANLQDEWWQVPSRIELLCALTQWRTNIDATASDPREELSFQAQLESFSRLLDHTPGVGGRVWTPGPPPVDWLEAHLPPSSRDAPSTHTP